MNKSIAKIFDSYAGFWNWKRLCDLTEPIANKIEKYIVICYNKGTKTIVVPHKYSTLYFRSRPKIQFENTVPYLNNNMKACSMTKINAEATHKHRKSCLKQKDCTYKIELLTQQTLF